MVFFNYASMEMSAKIVYYGPGLCGKTTNLKWIFDHMPQNRRGEMVSLATETDRTLFFDLLPLKLGKVGDFTTRIQLYTVPGQVFYNSTRKLVLKGVDGIVFVADSQEPMLDANIESLENLQENLEEQKLNLRKLPWVIQYNKRDLPGILPVSVLNRNLNFMDVPAFESIATTGQGVMDTLVGVAKLTLRHLRKKAGEDVPDDSDEMMMFEKELASAFGGEAQDKEQESITVSKSKAKKIAEKPDVEEDSEVLPEEPVEKKKVEDLQPSEKAEEPVPSMSLNVSTGEEQVLKASPKTTSQAEGIVIDKDHIQKIKIPIRINKGEHVSHINLNLKLEIECLLVSEISKKQESKAEKMAAKALEDFLLGKSKRKK